MIITLDCLKDFTPEEIKSILPVGSGARAQAWWDSTPKEVIDARNKKISKSWEDKTQEERYEINSRRGDSVIQTWESKPEKEKARISGEKSKRVTQYWKDMPETTRKEIGRKLSESGKRRWKRMPEEERLRMSQAWTGGWLVCWRGMTEVDRDTLSKTHSQALARMSEADRADRGRRISEGRIKYLSNRTMEEIMEFSKSVSDGWARRTDKEKTEFSKRKSEDGINFWMSLTEEEKNQKISKIMKSNREGPSEPELFLGLYLNSRFPGEWRYNGSGDSDKLVRFGGKTPDFVNINGKKEVVEELGVYWHPEEDEENRVRHYAKYGLKCIVVWQWNCYLWDELDKIFGVTAK